MRKLVAITVGFASPILAHIIDNVADSEFSGIIYYLKRIVTPLTSIYFAFCLTCLHVIRMKVCRSMKHLHAAPKAKIKI